MLNERRWRGLEDDIIKVGVMKYGTNKWSKISTLLQGRTPRQCKERWNRIAAYSTGFSEEDAVRLLEVVRLFPNQWSSVSQCFSDKSPQQCYEMYQRMLAEEARRSKLAQSALVHWPGNAEGVKKRVFNKDTGTFGIETQKQDICIVKNNRLVSRKKIACMEMGEDDRDLVDIARARIENRRGRKDLKRRVPEQGAAYKQLSNKKC